jgi:hypothetical protein
MVTLLTLNGTTLNYHHWEKFMVNYSKIFKYLGMAVAVILITLALLGISYLMNPTDFQHEAAKPVITEPQKLNAQTASEYNMATINSMVIGYPIYFDKETQSYKQWK